MTTRPLQPSNSKVTTNSKTSSISKRLQSELMSLMTSKTPGISAFPEGDNMLSWMATIQGIQGTPYSGQTYKLSIKFPENYPFSAPKVMFVTMIFHPNIDNNGNICLDILKDKWSAVYNVRTILLSIQALLGEPNNDSPLNTQAAQLWDEKEEYAKIVKKRFEENK